MDALTAGLQFATVALVAATLWVTWAHQRRSLKAELLRDSFTMYWQTYDPVNLDQVRELELYPRDYIDEAVFADRYRGDERAIRIYIKMSKMYEYLAYSHKLIHLKLVDPFGSGWLERWTQDLVRVPEFLDVHSYYAPHYPEFSAFVERCRTTGRSSHAA